MKVLFISHDVYRAGATILLLNFLRWLKLHHPEILFDVLIANKQGDLLTDFEKIAHTSIWIRIEKTSRNPLKRLKYNSFIRNICNKNYDLIYSNTIVNGHILENLKFLNVPIITHIHEMDFWIKKAGEKNLLQNKQCTTKFITTSMATKKCLVDNYNLDSSLITPVFGFISYETVSVVSQEYSIKQYLNIDNDAIIIGASGAEIWRKGKDLFIPLALEVLQKFGKRANIHFVWIGGNLNFELEYDLSHSEISGNVHFIQHLPNAFKYFHEFDVFAMLSREEPLGLVVLEASANKVPSVCFANVGGTPEILLDGGGFVVPYGNLHAFASKIVYLIENPDERKKMGEIARNTVIHKYDIEVIGKQLVEEIKHYAK